MNIAFFTLTKDRLDYTKRMFASLTKNTILEYDHFIVDNGSNDETVQYLKDISSTNESIKIIFNEDNKGIPIGSNQALSAIKKSDTDYDFIIKIDNDCEILTSNWLVPILEVINKFDNRIILSPRVTGLVGSKGGMPRYDELTCLNYDIGMVKHLGGICIVAPSKIYERFKFPVNGSLHGQDDINFSFYSQKKGYLMGYTENIEVAHADSTSGQIKKYPAYFKRRLNIEKKVVYGESRIITKLKKPWRRAVQIRKLHFLGLKKHGILSHILLKALDFFKRIPKKERAREVN